jgi:hypothetical protein
MNTVAPFGGTLTFQNIFGWAAALVRSPREFFRNMDREGGYLTPILYFLAWQFMAWVLWLLVSFLRPGAVPIPLWGKILYMFFGPGLGLAVGFVLTGILFVIWHLMGSSYGYRTAFRVLALISPLAILNVVPYVGYPVFLFYGFFLIVTASVEALGIRPRLAWTVWSLLLAGVLAFQIAAAVIVVVGRRLQAAGGAFPTGPGAFRPPQPGEMPEDIQKRMKEEMARAQAEFERNQKENPAPKIPAVPPPPKPKK